MADIVLNEKQFELLEKLIKESTFNEGEETDNEDGFSSVASDKGEKALLRLKDGLDSYYTALQMGTLQSEPFGRIYKELAEPLYKALSQYFYNSRLYKSTHS